MSDFIINNELTVRLTAFFGIFAIMATWEVFAPRRKLLVNKVKRWVNNMGLVFFNSLVVYLIAPGAAAAVAYLSAENSWGLFNNIEAPQWLAIAASVILLDFIIYLQHVMFHAIPLLWRLHRVHHADLDYDITLGSRFHTIEIILSLGIKLCSIILLGAPVLAVIVFEVLLNATAMFNHSNVSLNLGFDKFLRLFVVTPDMHRVHHSIQDDESNSNFGFNLPWWDRLMGTYKDQPDKGHIDMTIGLSDLNDENTVSLLPNMLAIPFMPESKLYTLNRRSYKKN